MENRLEKLTKIYKKYTKNDFIYLLKFHFKFSDEKIKEMLEDCHTDVLIDENSIKTEKENKKAKELWDNYTREQNLAKQIKAFDKFTKFDKDIYDLRKKREAEIYKRLGIKC